MEGLKLSLKEAKKCQKLERKLITLKPLKNQYRIYGYVVASKGIFLAKDFRRTIENFR